MLKNYVYLNPGLTILFNGEKFHSENGLKDLLEDNNNMDDMVYPVIHLKGDDIEVAITHSKTQYSEEYHSFVNGQHTTQGGTHQSAFREALVKTIRDYYGKNYDASDIRKSIISAIAIKVMEPVFESQTKTKLGSTDMGGDFPTVRTYINDFLENTWTIICIKIRIQQISYSERLLWPKRNVRNFLEYENLRATGPKKQTFITKSFAIAVFI